MKMIERVLIFVLLILPSTLLCQVKILMPVVVKDAGGTPVTDLKESDFHVSGPKGVSIDKMWLVPPATGSKDNPNLPITILYDAANSENRYPDLRTKWLRWLMGTIAQHQLPVTFYINTADGLHLIYSPVTPADVLATALARSEGPNGTSTDPAIEEQIKKLNLLRTSSTASIPRYKRGSNQMDSLLAVARLLQEPDERKALIWLADPVFVPDSETPYYDERPQYEAGIEELNAAHISVYPDLFSRSRGIYPQLQIASETGGLSFTGVSNPLPESSADFGPYYMLAVALPTPRDFGWIPIKIKVNRPGLTVRSSPGFYGLKPSKTQ